MTPNGPILEQDHAQTFLVPYLAQTEQLFRRVLRRIDSRAECRITPAADLCLPHDVIRIAGGFATGCLVEWTCELPVVPVDTTVNVDTTSIFWLSDDVGSFVNAARFMDLQARIEHDSSYEWNFHKGNHFIAFAKSRLDGRPAVVIHSNEKEFKYQYNGLVPVDGNWYADKVNTYTENGRYLRLLEGPKASAFGRIAHSLEPYNLDRHRFIAMMLVDDLCEIADEFHKHHYYMPTLTSVAIGCYLCTPGDVVPVLSCPGGDIHMFRTESGGGNRVTMFDGSEMYLVPHGWGKTSLAPVVASIDKNTFMLNDMQYLIEPKVSLGAHPGLTLRDFASDPISPQSLFMRMKHHTPGVVVNTLNQVCSYTKSGFVVHRPA